MCLIYLVVQYVMKTKKQEESNMMEKGWGIILQSIRYPMSEKVMVVTRTEKNDWFVQNAVY
jgi:hypothetical protein